MNPNNEQVKLAREWFASCDRDERDFIQTLLVEVEERVRRETLQKHNYFYHEPGSSEKEGFYYCLCGWEGPDRSSYWKHLDERALASQPRERMIHDG